MTKQTHVDATELLRLLESPDNGVVADIEQLIIDNLRTTKEAWLVNGLVDSFMVSHSNRCIDILAKVSEPHDKHLFDRVEHHLKDSKSNSHLPALTLLGHIVHKKPPWLHKITDHKTTGVMTSVIKCMKSEADVPVLVSGVLFLACLMPFVPVNIGPYLNDILEIFHRLATFQLHKPGHVPDVYMLHLEVGVYSLFHRIYGMYPCHFLTYLRNVYSRHDKHQVFDKVIEPMLQRVKMHPLLITASKDKELKQERWRSKEIHDIVIDCARLCLDSVEGSNEDPDANTLIQQLHRSVSFSRYNESVKSSFEVVQNQSGFEDKALLSPTSQSLVAMPSSVPFWSPSAAIGLSTPPPVSENKTSSGVFNSSTTSYQGTSANTPATTPRVPESPFIDDHDRCRPPSTPSQPLQTYLPHSQATHPQHHQQQQQMGSSLPTPSKCLSALSMSLSGRIIPPNAPENVAAGNLELSTPLSPMKTEFTAEPPDNAQRMQAIRKITFDFSDGPPDKIETHNVIGGSLDEAMEAFEDNVGGRSKSLAEIRLEKSPQLRLNIGVASSTEEFNALDIPSSDVNPVHDLNSEDGRPDDIHNVPSVTELPQYIDSLDVSRDVSDKDEETDLEVLEIITRERSDTDTSSSEVGAPSHLPGNVEMTAESVAAFMKKMNRIRFNTINVVRKKATPRKGQLLRSFSCSDVDGTLKLEEVEEVDQKICDDIKHKTKFKEEEELPQFSSSLPKIAYFDQHGEVLAPKSHCSTATHCEQVKSESAKSEVTTTTTEVISQVTTVTTTMSRDLPAASMNSTNQDVDGSAVLPQPQPIVSNQAVDVMYPYSHLLPFALPNAPGIVCEKCLLKTSDHRDASRHKPDVKPLYTKFSPPELLDRQILIGNDVYSKSNHLPNPSQNTVNNPADEISILRGQLLLLHNQMMFERHKRELHARRNRALLRKIVNTAKLEEENAAMQDQVRLRETVIQDLNIKIRLQQHQNNELLRTEKNKQTEIEEMKKAHSTEVEGLQSLQRELQDQLEQEQQQSSRLHVELNKMKSERFKLEEEMKSMESEVNHAKELRMKLQTMNQELLLMGELQQRYQQRLKDTSVTHNPKPEMQFIIDTLKEENRTTKTSLDQKTIQHDALKSKISDLEENLKNKDTLISEQKKQLEVTKTFHRGERQALEDKYKSQKKIQQTLHEHILDLQHQISKQQAIVISNRRRSSVNHPRSPVDISLSDAISIDTQTSPSLGFLGTSAMESMLLRDQGLQAGVDERLHMLNQKENGLHESTQELDSSNKSIT